MKRGRFFTLGHMGSQGLTICGTTQLWPAHAAKEGRGRKKEKKKEEKKEEKKKEIKIHSCR